jgi:hydroxymethylpyrimidine kinase/phosphomethylpyrimidine kinase
VNQRRIAGRPGEPIKVAMTIAGSDPQGGAGIQADLKAFASIGVHGFSVVTVLTAQNSAAVPRAQAVDAGFVAAQIETLVQERVPDAIKTGALGTAAVVKVVAAAIDAFRLPAPVVDPVFISTSGARLLDEEGELALRYELIPRARLVTPNLAEAAVLSGIEIDSATSIRAAARKIRALGGAAVLIKGGHSMVGQDEDVARDLYYDGAGFIEFTASRVPGNGAHGTGCALSAAIAAYLARRAGLETAIKRAKVFVTRALRDAYIVGFGRPVLDLSQIADRRKSGTRKPSPR